MAQTIISNPFGQVYPEHHRCENCIHWRGDWSSKVYAKVNGSTVWVGQCGSDDDGSPFADLSQGIAVVFTPCDGRCEAFEIHPDVVADYNAEQRHYAQLDDYLQRDAWA